MHIRGIRGAITVEENTAAAILDATKTLLLEVARQNGVEPDEVAAAFFTCTPDLNAAFPAEAARTMGWTMTPLLTATEVDVPGALPRCIRVLILWNTPVSQEQVIHVYLGDATQLRPDLTKERRGRGPQRSP